MRIELKLDPGERPGQGTLQVILINDEGFVESSDYICLSTLKALLEMENQP